MEENFVKVDLHIHSPASNCYKGLKNEDEYLRILHIAKTKDLKIIAITDHNSIEGYKNLLKIKEKLASEKLSLSSITDSKQVQNRLIKLKRGLSLFENILILPGIEFEVSNGIHLLIIFNNSIPIQNLEKFLLDGGYSPEHFGQEEPLIVPKWDIFAFYEESKKYDCFIIDAHTDSTKGILNTIPKGATRANCFRSSQLYAVCYKSEEQKDKLKSTIQSNKEYSRPFPLSFVRFSDSHSSENVGSLSTWVKIEQLSFEAIKKSFTNPSENVATEEPSMMKILDELISMPNSFGIDDISTDSKDMCKRNICALSNSEGGYVLIGVTKEKNKKGVPLSQTIKTKKKRYEPLISDIASCLNDIEPFAIPSITFYPLQNNRVIISIHVRTSDTLTSIKNDGRIYSIDNGTIKVISAPDAQAFIEQKVLKDMEQKIFRKLSSVENECNLIKNIFSSLPLIRMFEKSSREARFQVSLADSISLLPEQQEKLKKIRANGTSRGTLFFFRESQSPRLPYAYLRYSLPLFTVHNLNTKSVSNETIYIIPGGGAYYSRKDYPYFSERYQRIIKLHNSSVNSIYGMKFTICYLKSSLLIWYLLNKIDNTDIYVPEVFKKLRFPVVNTNDPQSIAIIHDIENNFDIIQNLEKEFLRQMIQISIESFKEFANQHNRNVDEIAYSIDKGIYKIFDFSDDAINIVEDNLRLNNIYIPRF